MNAVANISAQSFGNSKNYLTFVVRNSVKIFESERYTYQPANNTAEFLRQFYFGSLALFRNNSRGLCLFLCVPYILNFFLTMRNSEKVSSTGTKCVRSARPTVRKSVKSICTPIERNIFQITMDLVAVHVDGAGLQRRCGVIHCDLYEAHNEDEALGLAVATVRRKYGAFHDIDIRSIKRERRYNLTVKSAL